MRWRLCEGPLIVGSFQTVQHMSYIANVVHSAQQEYSEGGILHALAFALPGSEHPVFGAVKVQRDDGHR